MIILYKGRRGCGKTLSLVKDGYSYHKAEWRVYRNFSCEFGDYISNEDILNLNKESTIFNAVLMIDEIQIFFDSRRSMRKEALRFSNFIQQIRKRNIILLCTTQYTNTVDLRLRSHLDVMAYPDFDKRLKVCSVVYEDLTSIEDTFYMGLQPRTVKIVFNAKPFFKMYNTNQMII